MRLIIGLIGLFFTFVLAPVLAVWLQAYGTEQGWFTSPSERLDSIMRFAQGIARQDVYQKFLLFSFGAFVGMIGTLAFVRARIPKQGDIVDQRLLQTNLDTTDASHTLQIAITKLCTSIDNPNLDVEYNDAVSALTAATVSLKKLGIPVVPVDHKNRSSYLLSQRAILQALEPLVAAGHLDEARSVATELRLRLSAAFASPGKTTIEASVKTSK